MSDQIFAALSDPTRRDLYRRLAHGGPCTATSLAAELSITRQAVSKHLNVLSGAGMAHPTRVGRETRYEAALEPLGEVQEWISEVEGQWQKRLGALAESFSRVRTDG